ncbi:TetR/AcrR family transcriptional regulator [Actinomadura hibisca]|uniref:TetR/AcrR family transcriptional regulator n=1 Tax=Actinomadura hibisca TaxID=68565 RepID=UPI00082E23AB|nr:TetR/AcrR family transcriptional regulator [Actinomadura hibisca]
MTAEQAAAQPTGRKDARRNRERLLAAAEEAFARDGVGASLNDIARTAGVGNVTLYRHFPTRQALLEALLGESLRGLRARSDALLTDEDPARGLAVWLETAVDHATAYRGLVETLMDSISDPASELHATCRDVKDGGEQLLVRAQRAGAVRDDVDPATLYSLIAAMAWAIERTPDQRGRLVGVVTDGLRPPRP